MVLAAGYAMRSARPSEQRKRDVSAYVQDRMQREEKSYGYGYVSDVARKIGFTTGGISTAKTGKRGVGEDLAEALAKHWGIGTYWDLVKVATEWAEANRQATAVPSYPGRDEAALVARSARIVPEWAVRFVHAIPAYNSGVFASRRKAWWLGEMKRVAEAGLDESLLDGATDEDAAEIRAAWKSTLQPASKLGKDVA